MSAPFRRFRWQSWLDIAGQSILGLKDHPLRTALSILGVAIGVSAVILIATVSRGGKEVVFSELQTFGLRSVWVMRDRKVVDPRRVVRAGSGIDNDDVEAIRSSACCTALARFSPVVVGGRSGLYVQHGNRYSSARIEGVGGTYLEVNNDTIVSGRGLRDKDIDQRRNVAVVGQQVVADLFGANVNPLGQTIGIGRDKFEVIGVLGFKDRTFLSSIGSAGGQDANSRVLLPYNRLQQSMGTVEVDYLQGEASGLDTAVAASAQVTEFLKRRHKQAYSYRSETMQQYIAAANTILGGVSTVGLVAASVSLLVAGLGILNIMSTSVMERTREIGLRKALGGREREILVQFLLEALLISLIGGLIGLALGALGSVVITHYSKLPLVPSASSILLALGVSVFVGLVAGFYPALRAARMRPVEALRYE